MASVIVDSGQLPSAEGKEGSALLQVIAKWQSIAHGRFRDDCEHLLQMIDETDRFRLWEKSVGGFTFKDRDEFLQKKVLIDYDLTEQSLSEIVQRLRGGEDVKLTLRSHGTNQHTKNEGGDNVTSLKDRGNSAAYTIARLERDAPELAMAVREKRLSANAAAIQAGFRRVPTAREKLMKAWSGASQDDRDWFLTQIK